MKKEIIVLGSTGSIGTQTLDVCRHLGIKITAIAGGRNAALLEKQIGEFRPQYCGIADANEAEKLEITAKKAGTKLIVGADSAEKIAGIAEGDMVLNSVSGVAGLKPTLAAIESGRDLALANKESLVTGGKLVSEALERKGVRMIPVDSEHSAIYQCLNGNKIRRILLTCSGGPFFGKKREELAGITPSDALAHPTWNMGSRITIDSATLMNKGFEVIEAVRLFGVSPSEIEVLVHRESVVHSMVEYDDGAVIAQLGSPDMRLCIQYAFTCPERFSSLSKPLDFTSPKNLSFCHPDTESFPLLSLAYKAYGIGGVAPAVMNGADEEAVGLFLKGKISFTDISDVVSDVTLGFEKKDYHSADDVLAADREARRLVREKAEKRFEVK